MAAKRRVNHAREVEIVIGGGTNVPAGLRYPNEAEHRIKKILIDEIGVLIRRQGLTQVKAAELLGIAQSKISAMLHGRNRGISVYRLLLFVALLGREVRIVIKDTSQSFDL